MIQLRNIGLVGAIAVTPWLCSTAEAACSDPSERFVTNVSRTFDVGSAWSIDVLHRTAMLNGASVDGQDLVVWYAQRVQHIPRDEDELRMPIEWTSFEIKPRNFYFQNPAP